MVTLAGALLIGVALVAWTLTLGEADVSPLVGLVAFGLGWMLLGTASRPGGSPALGAVFGAVLYLALGLIWLIASSAVFRSIEAAMVLVANEPVEALGTVLIWPYDFWRLVLDRLLP
jgi:hypothetical protein